MALINCPECGKEMVSDSAESCPSCGFKIKKYFDQQNINQHTERIPKLYNDDDINMYKLVITDFYDTDTAAMAGLDDVLNIDLSYDEAMSLFKYESYIIPKYDSEEESILALKKLEKWGINAYIINPDGCINPYRVNVLESKNTNFSYNYASEKLKVDRTMAILCFFSPNYRYYYLLYKRFNKSNSIKTMFNNIYIWYCDWNNYNFAIIIKL